MIQKDSLPDGQEESMALQDIVFVIAFRGKWCSRENGI